MISTSQAGYRSFELLVSEDCNLRCKYCFDDQFHDRSKTEEFSRPSTMSLDLIDPLINFMIKTKRNDMPVMIQYFGGEPLVNFKFVKELTKRAIEVFGRDGVTFGVGTNGTLINREKIDFFLENKFKVNFSVDGKKETHDKQRIYPGGKGSWESAIKYIPELFVKNRAIKGPLPGANYTVQGNEVEHLEENYKFISELTHGNGQILWDFQSNWNEENLNKLKQIWDRMFLHGDIRLPKQYEDRIMGNSNSNCHTPESSITISSDGGMYFCHRLTPKMYEDNTQFKLGDIFDGITNERLHEDYRLRTDFKLFKKTSECDKCEVQHPCYGGCHASHKYNTGDLMKIDTTVMCRIYKIIYNNPLQEKIRRILGNGMNQSCQGC